MRVKLNQYKVPNGLYLFLIAMIGYWPISTLCCSPKWDMLDTILPWRYFVSECLRNGEFPLWNPYQQAGYPIFADLRSVWYPETIFTSFFIGTNVYLLQFLLIFYIFLAGYGMYRLLKLIEIPSRIAFVAGVVYMFSGYMVSQGQDMVRIIAAAGLPFILWFYLRLLKEKSWKPAIYFSIAMFLMITGGYQAVTIILNYLLILIFLAETIKLIRIKDFGELKKTILSHALAYGLVALMISPLIIAFIQAKPYISRFDGLDLKWVQYLPFSPQSAISFFTPYASVKENVFFDTDVSMRNAYFGIIMVVFFIASFFRKKTSLEKILLSFGVIALFASFGRYTPVREFLYHYVPLMNLFRMPSYFVLFFSFMALILASFQLKHFLENPKSEINKNLKIAGALSLVLIGLLLYSALHIDFKNFSYFKPYIDLPNFLERSSIYEHIFLQSLFQILLLCAFVFIIKIKNQEKSLQYLKYLILFDLFVSVQLNVFYTVADKQNPVIIQQYIEAAPKGFPLPQNEPIISNSDISIAYGGLWRNTNIYEKRFSADGFNSFWLNGLNQLEEDSTLYQLTLSNPIVFLSVNICSEKKWKEKKHSNRNKLLVISNSDWNKIKPESIASSSSDTCFIKGFKLNEFTIDVKTEKQQILTLLQSHFDGWKVYIDGRPSELFITNKNFISCLVKTGYHEVIFRYENPKIVYAGLFSLSIFLILLFITLVIALKNRNKRRVSIVIIVGIACIVVYGCYMPQLYARKYLEPYQKNAEQINTWINQFKNTALIVENINNKPQAINTTETNVGLIQNEADVNQLFHKLKNSQKNYLIYSENNVRMREETDYIINLFYPEIVNSKKSGVTTATIRKRSASNKIHQLKSTTGLSKNTTQMISDTTNHSNEKPALINATNPFGENIIISNENLNLEENREVLIHAKVKAITPKTGAYLVIQIDNGGVLKSWNSMPINSGTDWKETEFLKFIKTDKEDVIKIFVWNPEAGDLLYEDLEVEIY